MMRPERAIHHRRRRFGSLGRLVDDPVWLMLGLSHRPTRIRSVYNVELGADRTDMMAARDSRNFTDYVRSIWRDLEVGRA